MSETLKTGGEKSAESTVSSHLEVLTEMSGKFDAEKARRQVEQDKPKNVEKPKTERPGAEYLAVIPEKQEKELTPKDAANEYLSLLDELSQDFTNPYYKNGEEHGGERRTGGDISRDLGRKYSDNPHYRWKGYMGTEATEGTDDYTMVRMGIAETILGAEMKYRIGSEKIKEEHEKIDQQISKLDEEFAKKGRLSRFFGKRKHEKAKAELQLLKDGIEIRYTRNFNMPGRRPVFGTGRRLNVILEDYLATAYDETGHAGRNYGSSGGAKNKAERNEEANRRFFWLR